MLFFVVLEAAVAPFMTFLADEGLALVVPLGYVLKAVGYISPFLMIGAVARRCASHTLSAALIYFAIFAAADLIGQFPLAYEEYTAAFSSPFWFLLIVYMIISLLHSSFFLILLLLGYLLFSKKEAIPQERFFTFRGKDFYMSALCIAVIALQDLILFLFSFFEYLDDKLFLIDAVDIFEGLFSLVFIALCAFVSYASARFGARSFGKLPCR